MGFFEAIMMMLAFGTLLIALLRLIVEITNKK
ncbi:putative holin-like toxin [Virgibacillus siamensis]|nr:putative holin-like toxin [Virgibacillus siamensis]